MYNHKTTPECCSKHEHFKQIGHALTMMALGFLTNMDLRFFRGNGVVVTLAPLDIRLIVLQDTLPITHCKRFGILAPLIE